MSVAAKTAGDYADKMLLIPDACARFKMSMSTFLRFRKRHNIATLPGQQVHVDDVIAALDRERKLGAN